jgi:hypothetical protein
MADLPERTDSANLSEIERARLTTALATSFCGTKLEVVLLADRDGQLLFEATVSPTVSAETADALYALAYRIATHQAALSQFADHETHFFDWDGRQVIGKRIEVHGHVWLLIALCPAKTSYKQAFARVIKALEGALKADQTPTKPKRAPRQPKAK